VWQQDTIAREDTDAGTLLFTCDVRGGTYVNKFMLQHFGFENVPRSIRLEIGGCTHKVITSLSRESAVSCISNTEFDRKITIILRIILRSGVTIDTNSRRYHYSKLAREPHELNKLPSKGNPIFGSPVAQVYVTRCGASLSLSLSERVSLSLATTSDGIESHGQCYKLQVPLQTACNHNMSSQSTNISH
jgi:hypothetical protein